MPPKRITLQRRRRTDQRVRPSSSWKSAMLNRLPTVWHFRRSWTKFDTGNIAAAGTNGYSIKFNELPNFGEFVSLFEHYRIGRVKLQFFYTNNMAASNTHSCGYFYFLKDYNDDTPPPTLQSMLERADVKVCRLTDLNGRYFTQKFVPKVAQELYKSVTTTSYSTPKTNPYIDLANDNGVAPHFGFKIGYDQLITGASLRCIATMDFYCKGLK